MARNTARARDDVFEEVKRFFTDAEFIELTGICGYFGANNRFQDSMRLPIEAQAEVDKIKLSVRADPDRIKAYIEQILRYWPREFPEARQDPSTGPTTAGDAGRSSSERTENAAGETGQRSHDACRLPLLDPQCAQGETALFFRNAALLFEGVPNAIRVWAHSPYIAKLLLPQIVALQRDGAGSLLPGTLKAMLRIRTSHLHAAPYSLAHGTALARTAGVTEDQLAALATADCVRSDHFSPRERSALVWAEQVAPNTAKRRDDVFAALRRHFSDAEIVELTGLCAVSSQLDLIQNALRIPPESAAEIARINQAVRMDPQQLKAYLEALLENWPQQFPAIAA